ncbi:MAG: LysE family transporter [Phaeodactylibacter sp.]|nr:LysE family transporter [Phaeodactylibacter sp.]
MHTLTALMDGLLLGLSLALLVGPILITILQTSLEQGFGAGIAVGSGIWVSDTLFVLATYFGIQYVDALIAWEGFNPLLGTIGGLILALIGLGFLLAKPPNPTAWEVEAIRSSSYFTLWLKGFLINTVNPFTIFFWFTVATTVVGDGAQKEHYNVAVFYLGILGVIVLTDGLKAYLAKWIRKRLRQIHILRLRQLSGLTLILFGLIMIARVYFF